MATLDQLKQKYAPAIQKGKDLGLRLENMHMTGEKMFVRGSVPTEHVKNLMWDEIKRIDASFGDLTADLKVTAGETYTVQAGDSLSKIAKRFYGDANAYPKIFEANRDQLSDPNMIKVGQELKLP